MDDPGQVWAALADATDHVLAVADGMTILVVANRKGEMPDESEDRSTEYLSDNEANQLLTGFAASGFRTRYFEGERAFLRASLEGELALAPPGRAIVYSIAQSGTDAGRKSLVPAFSALQGLRVFNSGSYAVSLARNKLHVHSVLKRFGIPTPPPFAYRAQHGWLRGERPPAGELLIAKAIQESASIGLDADSVGTLCSAFEDILSNKSRALGQAMVVQPLVVGYEIEAPVVELSGRHHVLGPAIVTLGGDDWLGERVLDYATVARDGNGFAVPGVPHVRAVQRIQEIAPAVCDVLGLNGFARVDFRVAADGEAYVTDVATSPHLVWHSAFAKIFDANGWSYERMLASMVASNAARFGWI